MRQQILLFSLLTLLGCSEQTDKVEQDSIDPILQLTQWCFENWKEQQWTMGETNLPAIENLAFSEGIRKICRARAELYAEGYDIYPFITDTMQREVYALVFSANVEDIKSHLKQHLPKLQRI
ncbi:hypothetical protein [Methylophaga pinxianii]|uniref:hypothetical protein n=1 Tax=Methylophaga pinxianii TaxID=2881052 RepID=UPI001CF51AD4|nr:hypothetical protein [Methylophaga pinxianii]MCB2427502.1 hypothetical protein [Methylophaga pinxianii]UPH44780.1 hypothetical protein LGT42_009670 [Methylophaga pinxianii]